MCVRTGTGGPPVSSDHGQAARAPLRDRSKQTLFINDLKRGPDDNPTIGQYSVLKGSEQLFASKYRTLLPTEAELIAELERERRAIEQKQNGGDTSLGSGRSSRHFLC